MGKRSVRPRLTTILLNLSTHSACWPVSSCLMSSLSDCSFILFCSLLYRVSSPFLAAAMRLSVFSAALRSAFCLTSKANSRCEVTTEIGHCSILATASSQPCMFINSMIVVVLTVVMVARLRMVHHHQGLGHRPMMYVGWCHWLAGWLPACRLEAPLRLLAH